VADQLSVVLFFAVKKHVVGEKRLDVAFSSSHGVSSVYVACYL